MAVDWNEQAISGRQAEPTGPPESRVAVRPEMVRMGLERLKTHPPPPPAAHAAPVARALRPPTLPLRLVLSFTPCERLVSWLAVKSPKPCSL